MTRRTFSVELSVSSTLTFDSLLFLPADRFFRTLALGHPLAASGARITANLVHNLHRLNKRYAVGGACIGGGQGIAIVLERC